MSNKKEIVLYDSDWILEEEEQPDYDWNWDDFISNLKNQPNIKYNNGFIAIGYVNTWRGHYTGYSNNVSFSDDLISVIEKLTNNYDRVKIYFNSKGDLELALYHHDGTNYIVIRQLKEKYNDDYYYDKIETDLYNQDDNTAYKYTKSVKYLFKGWIY